MWAWQITAPIANVIMLRGKLNEETEGLIVQNLDFGPSFSCCMAQVR